MPLVDRCIDNGSHRDQATFSMTDVHLTTCSAIGTHRAHFSDCRFAVARGLVEQRPAGTCVHAGAAAHAGTFRQHGAAGGTNLRPVAAVPGLPDKSPSYLVADSHATETLDAPRHIDVN